MRLVLQRVKKARLFAGEEELAAIGPGLVILTGFGRGDGLDLPGSRMWTKLLDKIVGLRIFPDHAGKTNRSLADVQGSILAVSQFTLFAEWKKGKRPSFTAAAPPETARPLFDHFVRDLSERAPGPFVNGDFGRELDIMLCNWGPFTMILDSRE